MNELKTPNSIMPAKPRHTVLELKQFVDSANEFFLLGTGWQAQNVRRSLASKGKKVIAFIKSPLLPPLQVAPLRHRFGGRAMDLANTLIDQCSSVVEDYPGDSFYGLPVLDPASVDWKRAKTIICLQNRPIDAVCGLRERGLRPYVDFVAFPDMTLWPGTAWEPAVGMPFFEYWESHKSSFQRAMDCFGDEESQILYEKAIHFRIKALEFETLVPEDQPESFDTWKRIAAVYHKTRNKYSEALPGFDTVGKVAPKLAQFLKYFNPFGVSPKIIHRASWIISSGIFDHLLDKEETTERVILDCGAFEGESSAALHWMFQPWRIYAFEPLEGAFRKLDALARKMPALHPIKMGTWISSQAATLDNAGEGSRVNNSSGNGHQSILLTSIDDFVDHQALDRVDAVKMNIEGAELPSLRGAFSTIERFQPALSICAEHLPSDLWEIPTYLKQAHGNYVLSFKHFGPHIWASYVIGKANA